MLHEKVKLIESDRDDKAHNTIEAPLVRNLSDTTPLSTVDPSPCEQLLNQPSLIQLVTKTSATNSRDLACTKPTIIGILYLLNES